MADDGKDSLRLKRGARAAVSLMVDKIVPGGQAISDLPDGRKIFLWNALPGEIVEEVEITKIKSHYVEGIAVKISAPTTSRIKPKDSCYLSTSPYQIMDYNYELEVKRELLAEVFRQHKLDFKQEIPAVITDGKDFTYRNKMEYALYFDHADGKIKPAFHARGSHRKIPVSESSIERPEIWQRANEIILELNRHNEDARKFQSILLRCDQAGKVSGGLYENHQPHPQFQRLEDTLMGQKFSYSPNGFFQINLPVYEMVLDKIYKSITTDKVLDLYAGVGTIGLTAAPDKDLISVECDRSAYLELEHNITVANAQRTRPARDIFAKSENVLEYIAPDQTVIVDPPRAGCDTKLLTRLLEVQPRQIIYLSCNPATQARDAKILENIYKIIEVQPYNFFPRTPHLENLIILELK